MSLLSRSAADSSPPASPTLSRSTAQLPPLFQGLLGTDHVYVIPGAEEGGERGPRAGDKRK